MGSPLVVSILVIAISVVLVRRMLAAHHDAVAPAVEVSLAAAEALVDATRRAAVLVAILLAAIISAGWSFGVHSIALVSVGFAFAIQHFLNAWRVRQLLALPRACAEVRGTTLTACADGAHASVLVSRRGAAVARERGVPRAVVRD